MMSLVLVLFYYVIKIVKKDGYFFRDSNINIQNHKIESSKYFNNDLFLLNRIDFRLKIPGFEYNNYQDNYAKLYEFSGRKRFKSTIIENSFSIFILFFYKK